MKTFFVRHGQTNYNILDLCNHEPKKNVHLTELGKKQAEDVSKKLEEQEFDLVIVSELPRTMETAKIITKNKKTKFKINPLINDRNTGFESKPVKNFLEALKPDFFNIRLNGGESFYDEKKRVFSFLDELKKYKYKNVLIVAHGVTLKLVNGYFNNLSDQEIWDTKIDNCQILEFEI